MPHSLWDFSSPPRIEPRALAVDSGSPNLCIIREVPSIVLRKVGAGVRTKEKRKRKVGRLEIY